MLIISKEKISTTLTGALVGYILFELDAAQTLRVSSVFGKCREPNVTKPEVLVHLTSYEIHYVFMVSFLLHHLFGSVSTSSYNFFLLCGQLKTECGSQFTNKLEGMFKVMHCAALLQTLWKNGTITLCLLFMDINWRTYHQS